MQDVVSRTSLDAISKGQKGITIIGFPWVFLFKTQTCPLKKVISTGFSGDLWLTTVSYSCFNNLFLFLNSVMRFKKIILTRLGGDLEQDLPDLSCKTSLINVSRVGMFQLVL